MLEKKHSTQAGHGPGYANAAMASAGAHTLPPTPPQVSRAGATAGPAKSRNPPPDARHSQAQAVSASLTAHHIATSFSPSYPRERQVLSPQPHALASRPHKYPTLHE